MGSEPAVMRGVDEGWDAAYPTATPPDAIYPCQTLAPLEPPLDGLATPSMWSRLEGAFELSLGTVWERLALAPRVRPGRWVALYYGRIAINAHGWERLRARIRAEAPDPALVEPPVGAGLRFADWIERVRARLLRRRLAVRLRRAATHADRALRAVSQLVPTDLDTATLARGPLDERDWTELLLPWVGARLRGMPSRPAVGRVELAIDLELRFARELGLRLSAREVLRRPAEIAFLTIGERLRAVHDADTSWSRCAARRRERVESFRDVELPERFWGQPRVTPPENG